MGNRHQPIDTHPLPSDSDLSLCPVSPEHGGSLRIIDGVAEDLQLHKLLSALGHLLQEALTDKL